MLFAQFILHKANHAYGLEMQKHHTKELKPGNHCFVVVYACKQLIFIRIVSNIAYERDGAFRNSRRKYSANIKKLFLKISQR